MFRSAVLLPTVLVAGLLLASALPSPGAAQDPLTERKAGFDGNRKAMAEIKGVLDQGGSVKAAVDPAKRMAAFADRIPSLFPPGSDAGKTAALPAVWADPADFAAKAKAFGAAASALAQAADADDRAGVGQRFAAVAETCKACHTTYRK